MYKNFEYSKLGAKLKKQRRISETRQSLDKAVKEGMNFEDWKKLKAKEDRARAKAKKEREKQAPKKSGGKKKKAKKK